MLPINNRCERKGCLFNWEEYFTLDVMGTQRDQTYGCYGKVNRAVKDIFLISTILKYIQTGMRQCLA